MNPSPSSQSVGSLKPSTAASTTSSRRTRTIIVARNLPDATTTASTTPSTPASSQHRLPGSRHQHNRPRDAKLNSYAALGSEADVELYERFLSEKKSQGDAIQVSDGPVASPAFLKGSPKRRSMLQLHQTQGDVHVEGNANIGVPLATATMLADAAADVKQRRDAVMQHRKWLKSLPIHERLAYERQQNVLTKWKTINRQWQDFKQRTSKRLGKSEKQLVMSRASEYRDQIELYDALQRATPLSEKVAGDFWLVSLRNEGTRYVPVGNIFSGLYCPIRESTKLQPRVRRPLDYVDTVHDADGDDDGDTHERIRGKVLSTIEKRSLEVLERKKRRLKKQLEALYPHEVEPSHSGQLKVDTVDLFEWASRGSDQREMLHGGHHTASMGSLLLPLKEEDDHENNAGAVNSIRSSSRSRRSARRKGPSLYVFTPDSINGPDAADTLQPQRVELTFFVDVGVLQHHTVRLENNGTTALQFQWRREDLVEDDLARRLTHHDPSPLAEPERIVCTSISQREGFVLPDEELEFVFSFRSKRPGVWLEQWVLDVDPPLPKTESAAIVHVQATAVDNFVPATQRRKFHARVTERETAFTAEQVLKHDVICRVDSQYVIEFFELSDQARIFYDTNRRGEYDGVQFSERLLNECRRVYADALAVLTPPVIEEVKEAPAEAVSAQDLPGETEASPLLSSHPEIWNLKLSSLKDVAIAADAKLLTEYTAFQTQLIADRSGQDEEDDEDDQEDDLMERILGTKRLKRAAEQAALRALEPHFFDDFQSITLAAHVSPYEPRLLSETLSAKLANMASEAAVVVEIAQMIVPQDQDACNLLRPLLVRALSDSLAVDRERERIFEYSKRHFHSVQLSEKTNFHALPQLLADASPPSADGMPTVIFLQVDLDIANWFTLSSVAPNIGPLEWKLARKLLDHDTHVPPKVAAAATSIRMLLETIAASGHTPMIVILSELTMPPMTKAMKRMEVAAAKAVATAARTGDSDGLPTPEDIEAIRQTLAAKRERQLSLRDVAIVLQRAMGISGSSVRTVEFLGSLPDLEEICKLPPSRPATPTDASAESAVDHERLEEKGPRIILLDHFGALARQALKKSQEVVAPITAPAAVAPVVDKGKLSAVNDKKKSASVPPPTQAALKPVGPTPIVESAGDDNVDTIEILPGTSLEMMAAQKLGERLAKVGRFIVVDFFPRSWWESTFVYFAAPPLPTPTSAGGDDDSLENALDSPKHLLVGPQLVETFKLWRSLFQPLPSSEEQSSLVPMKAVVGGRGLERKLRLIDGLLERVDTIYFVGELAATFYRVLYAKQVMKRDRLERKPVPRYKAQRLVAAVERLTQKAYRKQVELLLPFDFVVGESLLELDVTNPTTGDEDEEEDDEAEEDEEEDEEDDDDARKKKAKKKATPAQPLVEPSEIDTWRSRPSYDGERGIVEVDARGWINFAEVTLDVVERAMVVDGKASLLDGTEAEPEDTRVSPPQEIPELDWTLRIFDVGPKSTQVLLEHLRVHRDDQTGWVFVNGTLGAVEYRDFDAATRQLASFLQAGAARESVLMTGRSTCRWLELLGWLNSKRLGSTMVSSGVAKQEAPLSHVIESTPHAMLTAFDCRKKSNA